MNLNHQPKRVSGNNRVRMAIYPFFWFVAAADEKLLKKCPVAEQDKQAGIGITIVCTAIAAFLSCYYAISTLFENLYTNILLALFWMLIIFNLDRIMVGSMRKHKNKDVWREIKVATPRIILAVFIAVLISKPL